jgi:hypothetical protein
MRIKYKQKLDSVNHQLKSNNVKKIISFVAIIIVIVLLVYSLVSQKDILLMTDWHLNIKFLALTILIYISALFVIFYVWYLIMENMEFIDTIQNHLLVFSKSIVARRIPLPVWYIGSRFYYYNNSSDQKSKISTAILIEIILTGLTGILINLIYFSLYFRFFYLWIIIAVYLIFLYLTFSNKKPQKFIAKIFGKIFKNESLFVVIPAKNLWLWFLIYSLSWVLSGLTFYFGIKSLLLIDLNILLILLISSVSGLIGYITMILPAGFGLKEITTGLLLTQSIPFGVGLLLAIINRFFTTLIEVIWSVVIMFVIRNNP